MKSLDKIAGVKINAEEPMGQLIIELDKAESSYRHVPLAEFRDHILPKSGLTWAKDPAKVTSLLKDAIDRDLILTYRMLLSHNIMDPTTTVRLNRSGKRIKSKGNTRRPRFEPIHIPGVSLSDTVIQERREDWR
ncbi:MAG: hypothetical protein F4Z35_01760 [Dehalococcoidia bacterium]|nr:hypothetical protein [Dehalococcoidia bacterium]